MKARAKYIETARGSIYSSPDTAIASWYRPANMRFSQSDMLLVGVNMSSFSSDLYGDTSQQIFKGVSWRHYFGPPGRSFFGTIGYGKYEYDWQGSRHYICWGSDCNPPPSLPISEGKGLLAEFGYEFSPHWQVGASVAGRKSEGNWEFSLLHVNLLLGYTWY